MRGSSASAVFTAELSVFSATWSRSSAVVSSPSPRTVATESYSSLGLPLMILSRSEYDRKGR
ncbi:hypothetical protein [Streptomyces bottropensis]|uniref:hypothetical protein n=1 Tax=Streptomyces bottropensis TaxID=42235 RepID=UPI003679BA56